MKQLRILFRCRLYQILIHQSKKNIEMHPNFLNLDKLRLKVNQPYQWYSSYTALQSTENQNSQLTN